MARAMCIGAVSLWAVSARAQTATTPPPPAPATAPTSPAAGAPAAPAAPPTSPVSTPSMAGPLTVNVKPESFDIPDFGKIYVSGAVECEIDDVGRILIPPALREHARLRKEVVWAGSGRYAELWDKEEWSKRCETTEDERRQIAARISELGL